MCILDEHAIKQHVQIVGDLALSLSLFLSSALIDEHLDLLACGNLFQTGCQELLLLLKYVLDLSVGSHVGIFVVATLVSVQSVPPHQVHTMHKLGDQKVQLCYFLDEVLVFVGDEVDLLDEARELDLLHFVVNHHLPQCD